MRLAILGGGGFRVPQVYQALLRSQFPLVSEVALHDAVPARMEPIRHVLTQMAAQHPSPPRIRLAANLDDAVQGADFVFNAIRVGGLRGRVSDEHIPLAVNLLGQETVGAGGILSGLRTIPVALSIAERIAALAPRAWLINFTNPAGMVTEALSTVLGDRVIGVCDSPSGLCRRVARTLGVSTEDAWFDYAGLNHLGWLRGVYVNGEDWMPQLLADRVALASFEEGALFGPDRLQEISAIPNEYLHYFYFHQESIAAARSGTRGDFLMKQQEEFYAATARNPGSALAEWNKARHERESTYMAESREITAAGERASADLDAGGYENVALPLLGAIAGNQPATLILNVRNRSAIPHLPQDSVVEVPCLVNASGAHPVATGPADQDRAALMAAVKASERATIDASLSGSQAAATQALAIHPLVDSVPLAQKMIKEYWRLRSTFQNAP